MTTINKNILQDKKEYKNLLVVFTKYFFIGSSLLFGCYLYTIGAITFAVVERKGLEESTKQLLSNISIQELKYLEQEKKLTKDIAYAKGLVEASKISFTTQKRAFAWNVR